MTETPAATGPSPDFAPAVAAGMALPSTAARRMVRAIGFLVVVVPFLGTITAFALFWSTPVSFVQYVLFVLLYFGTLLGISVGFHRYCSHHAFQTTNVVRALLVILGSMAAQGPVLYWVANHRRHHAYTDRTGDVHSPHLHGAGVAGAVRGIWHAHTGWIFKAEMTDWVRYVPDLLKDRLLFVLNDLYPLWIVLGLTLPAVAAGVWTQSWMGALQGLLAGGLARMFVVHHVTWSINSICHAWGRRAFDTPDESRNSFLFALLAVGEGWHNNHHAYPPAAVFGLKRWQIDGGGALVRLLARCGLAWDVRSTPATVLERQN